MSETRTDIPDLAGDLLSGLRAAVEPDRLLMATVSAMIRGVGYRYALDAAPRRRGVGEPLRLLLAGYNGTRNTGADVRVNEMIRQFRHVLGEDTLELSVMTQDFDRTAGYFPGVRQVLLPPVFPPFLLRECPRHDGVVACEGSMFKSKFADALTTMMAGSLGFANAENKLSIGYGGEAGAMSSAMRSFVREHCRDSVIFCRNAPSQAVLEDLGLRTHSGADTAWTFEPAQREVAHGLLREAGWDGRRRIVVGCAIDPFCWPVRPNLKRAAGEWLREDGGADPDHFRAIYFHERTADAADSLERYLTAFADGMRLAADRLDAFPVMVGMEALDRRACEAVSERLGGIPCLVSDTPAHDMGALVAVLRCADLLLTSRFHAMVCAMPAGVPGVGITMDERIANLMVERGHEDFLLRVDDPELGGRLADTVERAVGDLDRLSRECLAGCLPHLKRMGEMGLAFRETVLAHHPDLEVPVLPAVSPEDRWLQGLPPLPADVLELMNDVA
ncbi:MAG: hypothetical protein EA398_15105 [Deltaproteobacteria bacterium]|nr:MAG: hypothetical protein EA398_15105 [Deltaproteobacteria bacterium]